MKVHSRFRYLPMPTHSLLLFIVWLALNNTLAPGHLVLGGILAIIIPLLVAGLESAQPAVKRYDLVIPYLLMVLYDIVVANLEVAMKVLGPTQNLRPAFIAIQIETQNELMITILASTISLTPGTVSTEVSQDRQWLYLHVLHLEDEQALIALIKQRYEGKLREIFGC